MNLGAGRSASLDDEATPQSLAICPRICPFHSLRFRIEVQVRIATRAGLATLGHRVSTCHRPRQLSVQGTSRESSA